MSKKQKESLTYEAAMEELKFIVNELQEEAVSIDDLSGKAKKAEELIRFCREKLRSTEEDLKGLFESKG